MKPLQIILLSASLFFVTQLIGVKAWFDIDPDFLYAVLAMGTATLASAVELKRSRPIGIDEHIEHSVRLGVLEKTTLSAEQYYELQSRMSKLESQVEMEEVNGENQQQES